MKSAVPVVLGLIAAFSILFISILRTASVVYDSKPVASKQKVQTYANIPVIEYVLAKPGSILPGDILWPLKAARDKIWLAITTDASRKADLKLLLADKRLGAAQVLIERGDFSTGIPTLIKAERYLQEALNEHITIGMIDDHGEPYDRLANSALKHVQIIEQLILISPEDVDPDLIGLKDIPLSVYSSAADKLREAKLPVPQNPFVTE